MDDSKLIDLVEQFNFIYDKKQVNFKNKYIRQKAWQSIATAFHDHPHVVEARWNVLRNRYAAERRKLRQHPPDSVISSAWVHFEKMSFLDEFMQERRTSYNMKSFCPNGMEANLKVKVEDDLEYANSIQYPAADPLLSPTLSDSSAVLQSSSSESTNPATEGITDTQKMEQQLLKSEALKREPDKVKCVENAVSAISKFLENEARDDEDDLFGKSIAAIMKNIKNRSDKIQAKTEIYQVLCKYDK